jgi:alkylation response protein AidB-like acyl-CoA dehydrogenase
MAATLPKNAIGEQQKGEPAPARLSAARARAGARARRRRARDRRAPRASQARIVDRLVDDGFFRLLLPRSLGGAELLPAQYVPIIEAIARIDASTAWCLNQNSGCSMTAAYLPPEVARDIFGGPRGILAWGPGPGEARVVAGGYNVTATWAFASGSHHASWLGCHVPVIESNGQPRREADGTPVVRTLFFPKSSTKFTDIWHTIGLRGTGSDQYSVTDLFVPEAYSLPSIARNTPERRREPGLLYSFSSLSMYAAGFAGVAMGCARSTLASFIELARDKIPRGARKTMRDNNVTQSQVGQAEARLSSAYGYLLRSLGGHHRGGARARPRHLGRADDDPAGLDLLHPYRARSHRHALSGGGRDRDLRREPVRAAVARRAQRVAAIAGPPGAFRDGRPAPDGPRTRYELALRRGRVALEGRDIALARIFLGVVAQTVMARLGMRVGAAFQYRYLCPAPVWSADRSNLRHGRGQRSRSRRNAARN